MRKTETEKNLREENDKPIDEIETPTIMTPRTRLQTKPAGHFPPRREVVPVEFAIGLEMELNAAQTTLQSIAKALGSKSTFREDLLRQIQTLRA